MERRCPAAGGVKHARGGVRQGVITHHPLVPSSTHDGQGHAPTTRACVGSSSRVSVLVQRIYVLHEARRQQAAPRGVVASHVRNLWQVLLL